MPLTGRAEEGRDPDCRPRLNSQIRTAAVAEAAPRLYVVVWRLFLTMLPGITAFNSYCPDVLPLANSGEFHRRFLQLSFRLPVKYR
jgi:hypothetical protein